jgi:hypothetical protein
MGLVTKRRFIWFCVPLLVSSTGETGVLAGNESGDANVARISRYPNVDASGNDKKWLQGIRSVEQCESLCLADCARPNSVRVIRPADDTGAEMNSEAMQKPVANEGTDDANRRVADETETTAPYNLAWTCLGKVESSSEGKRSIS